MISYLCFPFLTGGGGGGNVEAVMAIIVKMINPLYSIILYRNVRVFLEKINQLIVNHDTILLFTLEQ
jgi:hypothetical protein